MSLSVTYGQHLVTRASHETVRRIGDFGHAMTNAAAPANSAWLELFPFLQHVPAWFPGAGWKRNARALQREYSEMFQQFLEDVRVRMVRAWTV